MIHKQIRSLVPESQAYIELLRLEQKLDSVLMRKRLDITRDTQTTSESIRSIKIQSLELHFQ